MAAVRRSVRVSWQATYDQDNENLTYKVIRSDKPTTPVFQTTARLDVLEPADRSASSTSTVTAGHELHLPGLRVTTRSATRPPGAPRPITVSADDLRVAAGRYADTVLADGPSALLAARRAGRVDDGYDQAGFDDLTLGTGVTEGVRGRARRHAEHRGHLRRRPADGPGRRRRAAVPRSAGRSASRPGSRRPVDVRRQDRRLRQQRTPATAATYDRHVYMDDVGPRVLRHLARATRRHRRCQRTATTTAPGTTSWPPLGPAGHGAVPGRPARRTALRRTGAQDYSGYWRVGGDSAWAGANCFDGDDRRGRRLPDRADRRPGGAALRPSVPPVSRSTSRRRPRSARPAAGLTASVDGTASTDPDGTVAGYAWDFGDGATGDRADRQPHLQRGGQPIGSR